MAITVLRRRMGSVSANMRRAAGRSNQQHSAAPGQRRGSEPEPVTVGDALGDQRLNDLHDEECREQEQGGREGAVEKPRESL